MHCFLDVSLILVRGGSFIDNKFECLFSVVGFLKTVFWNLPLPTSGLVIATFAFLMILWFRASIIRFEKKLIDKALATKVSSSYSCF